MKFTTHAEKEFWQQTVLACLRAGISYAASQHNADAAITARRDRMELLVAEAQ